MMNRFWGWLRQLMMLRTAAMNTEWSFIGLDRRLEVLENEDFRLAAAIRQQQAVLEVEALVEMAMAERVQPALNALACRVAALEQKPRKPKPKGRPVKKGGRK